MPIDLEPLGLDTPVGRNFQRIDDEWDARRGGIKIGPARGDIVGGIYTYTETLPTAVNGTYIVTGTLVDRRDLDPSYYYSPAAQYASQWTVVGGSKTPTSFQWQLYCSGGRNAVQLEYEIKVV